MKILKQSQSVSKKTFTSGSISTEGVHLSSCGCPNACYGLCLGGKCLGYCG